MTAGRFCRRGSWLGLALVACCSSWHAPGQAQPRPPAGEPSAARPDEPPPAAPAAQPDEPPPAAPAAQFPISTEGSLGPGVFLEDISYTTRLAYYRTVTVSWHDPKVAYVGSWDGYVWKTIDGGRTWDESRLIVEPFPFYGDKKERLYFGIHRYGGGADSLFGGFGGGLSPPDDSARGGIGQESSGGATGGTGGRGSAANANFGIGLPGSAPRLQLLVRKFGKPTSGLNIKQMLLVYGDRPTEVRILVVHPKNPQIVFACTAFGLFKTYDGGLNWVRTFIGTSKAGRMAFHVAIDPQDPQKVLLATGEGVYISQDGGENFLKSTAKGVGEGVINWIYYNPYDSRYVFAGTDNGMLRSADGGGNWEYIYYTTFPTARVVRSIVIDPFDKKTGYIATHDGMFTTPDLITGGLESWERLGGLQFTGIETSKIAACPKHKGHLWVLTNMMLPRVDSPGTAETGGSFVLETLDGGENWSVIYSGNTAGAMMWFDNDPSDPDLLWMVWSRSLVRMRPASAREIRPEQLPVIPDLPPMADVLAAARFYTGTDPGLLLEYRSRSRLKALMPKLSFSYTQADWHRFPILHDSLYPSFPFRFEANKGFDFQELRMMVVWDLSDLVFNLQASLFGRIDRLIHEHQSIVNHVIHRFYGELQRLQILMANEPPAELRVRLIYKLRIEELTSYVNFLTGNYLRRWSLGDRPSGRDTKWWVPWKVGPAAD